MALTAPSSSVDFSSGFGSPGTCGHASLSPGLPDVFGNTAADTDADAAIAAAAAPVVPSASAVTTGGGAAAPRERERRVRFHPTTKENDGLRHTTDMFNEYMRDVFRTAKRPLGQTTVSVLARNLNVLGLVTIQKMLADLIWRCDRSRRGRAVVLSQGGGAAGSITRRHIPYLVSHVEYLETVIGKVRTVIARKEKAAHMQ